MIKIFTLALISCVLASAAVQSEENEKSSLYSEIIEMDRILFDAFNSRDLEKTKEIFDRDLEFYHDAGGLSDYEQAIENSRKLFERNIGLKRELQIESVEIYPIKDYGAIETGSHKFCHMENGKNDCGTFKFLHVWKKMEDRWTLARVVSYAH